MVECNCWTRLPEGKHCPKCTGAMFWVEWSRFIGFPALPSNLDLTKEVHLNWLIAKANEAMAELKRMNGEEPYVYFNGDVPNGA